MSCQLSEDSTINNALTLWHVTADNRLRDGITPEYLWQLGQDILECNREAYRQRYGGRHGEPEDIPFELDLPSGISRIQAYKSLTYLIYQCSEGTCETMAAYKLMAEKQQQIAHELVAMTPEYESANWS